MTWLVGAAGLSLIVGSLISQLLHALSRQTMVDGLRYLAAPNHITVPDLLFSLDVGPIAVGIVLAVIATAFKIDERRQRDTEGLV